MSQKSLRNGNLNKATVKYRHVEEPIPVTTTKSKITPADFIVAQCIKYDLWEYYAEAIEKHKEKGTWWYLYSCRLTYENYLTKNKI